MNLILKTLAWFFVSIFVLMTGASTSHATRKELQQRPERRIVRQFEDPIRQLNLTPEQREQIRAINQLVHEERAALELRRRETSRALEEALEADFPDEAVIEQRLHDLAEAQAASMRMRVLTEVRIRRVLTPEQLETWRTMRRRAIQSLRERVQENPHGPRLRRFGNKPNQPDQSQSPSSPTEEQNPQGPPRP